MLVFVYGSLLSGLHNHDHFLGSARFRGEAATHEGRFAMVSLGGFPGLVAGDGDVVGELYEVDDATAARLDRLEGHPTFYRREPVRVIGPRGPEVAQAYILRGDRPRGHSTVPGGDWRAYREATSRILLTF